jgi:hypothetical protein
VSTSPSACARRWEACQPRQGFRRSSCRTAPKQDNHGEIVRYGEMALGTGVAMPVGERGLHRQLRGFRPTIPIRIRCGRAAARVCRTSLGKLDSRIIEGVRLAAVTRNLATLSNSPSCTGSRQMPSSEGGGHAQLPRTPGQYDEVREGDFGEPARDGSMRT